MPAIKNPSHCIGVGSLQCKRPKGRLSTVTEMACHSTMTPEVSVRVRLLVTKKEAANSGEDASMMRKYQPPSVDKLGPTTTITPANPTRAAIQRSACIFSPRNQAAPSMMKIGPVKPIAVMSASPIRGKAVNQNIRPTVCKAPRHHWPIMFNGRYAASPPRSTSGKTAKVPKK